MQMNLMIRITGSFLSLISFAASVISEAPTAARIFSKVKSLQRIFGRLECSGEQNILLAGRGAAPRQTFVGTV